MKLTSLGAGAAVGVEGIEVPGGEVVASVGSRLVSEAPSLGLLWPGGLADGEGGCSAGDGGAELGGRGRGTGFRVGAGILVHEVVIVRLEIYHFDVPCVGGHLHRLLSAFASKKKGRAAGYEEGSGLLEPFRVGWGCLGPHGLSLWVQLLLVDQSWPGLLHGASILSFGTCEG